MSDDRRPKKRKFEYEDDDDDDEYLTIKDCETYLNLLHSVDIEKYNEFIRICKDTKEMKTDIKTFIVRVGSLLKDTSHPELITKFREFIPKTQIEDIESLRKVGGVDVSSDFVSACEFLKQTKDQLDNRYGEFIQALENYQTGGENLKQNALNTFKDILHEKEELFEEFIGYLPRDVAEKMKKELRVIRRERRRNLREETARDLRSRNRNREKKKKKKKKRKRKRKRRGGVSKRVYMSPIKTRHSAVTSESGDSPVILFDKNDIGLYGPLGPSYGIFSDTTPLDSLQNEVLRSRPITSLRNDEDAAVSEFTENMADSIFQREDHFTRMDVRISNVSDMKKYLAPYVEKPKELDYSGLSNRQKRLIRRLYSRRGAVFGRKVLEKLESEPEVALPVIVKRLETYLEELEEKREEIRGKTRVVEFLNVERFVQGEAPLYVENSKRDLRDDAILSNFDKPFLKPDGRFTNEVPYIEREKMDDLSVHQEVWRWVREFGDLDDSTKAKATVLWERVVLPLMGIELEENQKARFVERSGGSCEFYGDANHLLFFYFLQRVYHSLVEIRVVCKEEDAKKKNENAGVLEDHNNYPPAKGILTGTSIRKDEIDGETHLQKLFTLVRMKFSDELLPRKYNATVKSIFGVNCFPVLRLTNCEFPRLLETVEGVVDGTDEYARLFVNEASSDDYFQKALKLTKKEFGERYEMFKVECSFRNREVTLSKMRRNVTPNRN